MKYKLPRLSPHLFVIAAMALVATGARAVAADPQAAPIGGAAALSVNQAAAAGLATPTTAAASNPGQPSPGDELLSRAAAQLERRNSLFARLRHKADVGGRQLYGLGSYWQQGSGEELRVRLELQIAGQEAALLQVSNGRRLWVERRLPSGRTVSYIDLRQLRADAMMGVSQLDAIQPGSANWMTTPTELIAHSGGLPSMLASLSENFEFMPPQAMRLADQAAGDPQSPSLPVWAIVGHWRAAKLAGLLVKEDEPNAVAQDGSSEPPKRIPARLPEEVLILVGQGDLFPYRIEYRKLETPTMSRPAGTAIPYQLSANPMVVLELTDVSFDIPVETGQFDYVPGDVEWTDQTAAVLQKLRHRREQQVAGRPAAAPK